jgi:hypothetical protein
MNAMKLALMRFSVWMAHLLTQSQKRVRANSSNPFGTHSNARNNK